MICAGMTVTITHAVNGYNNNCTLGEIGTNLENYVQEKRDGLFVDIIVDVVVIYPQQI